MDGNTYHAHTDCGRRTAGSRRPHRRGLADHPVERITRAEAEAYLYQPCPACTQPGSSGLVADLAA
ncbi:MAG: hypothetical protein OEP52_06935 [Acidimicrobiia bacterium]|nr:hypothetical protein [Acidimicrobiia bacterium]